MRYCVLADWYLSACKTMQRTAFLPPLLCAVTTVHAGTEPGCLSIRQVTIETQDIYPESKDITWFESTLNFLHYRTRENVVKQELLFKEGDCYAPQLVEETARNLRAFSIFADARIITFPVPGEQAIDLHVVTEDRFTFRTEISASHNAGTTKNRISFGDKNLFGQNKSLHYSRSAVEDETETRFTYKDNRFTQDYALFAQYEAAFDGAKNQLGLSRPFRQLEDRYSYGANYEHNDQNYVYSLDDGDEIEIPRLREGVGFSFAEELGNRIDSHRIGLSMRASQESFGADQSTLPIELPNRLEKIDIDFNTTLTHRDGFKVIKGLDSLIYREDIELSEAWLFGIGVQWRHEKPDISYHPKFSLGYQHTHFYSDRWLSSVRWINDWRIHAGKMREHNSTAFYHLYFLPSDQQAFVTGLAWQYHYARDELSEPLKMGGSVGLRGYEAGSFTGNKSLLLNLEHRYRFNSPWEGVGLGQALFLDSGFAWKHGKNVRGADLKVNAGWGLRIDIPSLFGKNIVRFDIAVATETGEVLATLVMGQVFRYNELSESSLKEF